MGGEGAVESERIEKWEGEMAKRNAYFLKFEIATLTYTDAKLAYPDQVFNELASYLEPAPASPLNLLTIEQELLNYPG